MANFHLRDKSLSLKAVGLLSKMLSFNDGWKFSTKGLSAICKEGPDAILSALRELEKHGYLVRHRQRDGKGRMSNTIFEIYEEPQESTPEREKPHTENPCVEKPDVDNPRGDKSTQINTDQVITQERNTLSKNYQSINLDGMDRMDERSEYKEIIKENSQLFNLLCDKADDVYNGRLPVHVRCLLDEFANIGQIPKFDKLIATIRSREISASIILQSQSQLKTIYKDAADTITGNCDCTLFLGGKEKSTLKEISEVLGKETIDLYNTSETRSNNNSYGLNYQKTGKELMSQDEIAVMDGAKCILQLRGVRPFLSNKYDITKHPKYRQLSDYDKRNTFDIEKYRQHKLVVKPDDTFDLYDMGEVDAD